MPVDGENGIFHFAPEARATGDRNSEAFYKQDQRKIKDKIKELEEEVAELKRKLKRKCVKVRVR